MSALERLPEVDESGEVISPRSLSGRAAELAIDATVTGLRLAMTPLASIAFEVAKKLPSRTSLDLDGLQPTAYRPSIDTQATLLRIDDALVIPTLLEDI